MVCPYSSARTITVNNADWVDRSAANTAYPTKRYSQVSLRSSFRQFEATSIHFNGRNVLYDGQEMTLDECRAGRDESLKAFSMSYCFLLLFVSRNSSEPAKERMYFEVGAHQDGSFLQ